MRRIRASVIQDSDELLQNVARCTALISSRPVKTDGVHSEKGESGTRNILVPWTSEDFEGGIDLLRWTNCGVVL